MFGKRAPRTPAPLTAEALERVQTLVVQGKQIQAIKELREATGLALAPAKEPADALKAGRPLPWHVVPPESLADRVRGLRDADRIADAVRTAAAETGVTETEASRFIDALD